MSKKKSDNIYQINKRVIILFLSLPIVLAIVIATLIFYRSTKNPAPETANNQMRRLPPLVIKNKPSPSQTFKIPILLYHYIENVTDRRDTIRISLNIPPLVFDKQIETLKAANYTFLTMADVADILDGVRAMPVNPIVLTFDDGHWDLQTDILPILKKYNVHATAFIVPGLLGGSDYMTPAQLQDVVNSGLVEIGAHTVHHLYLKNRPAAVAESEILQSKTLLENNYHVKVISFAYPYGAFDEQAIKFVQQGGFKTAVSTLPGVLQSDTNRMYLYRIRPGQRVGQSLITYLAQNVYHAY